MCLISRLFPSLDVSLKSLKWSLSCICVALIVTFFGLQNRSESVDACGGDPTPFCGKALAFSYEIPKSVCDPGDGSDICIDIETVTWFNVIEFPPGSGICPPGPYRGTLEFSIVCDDGTVLFQTVDIPDVPLGYSVNVVSLKLPSTGVTPRKCTVDGSLVVTFGDGMVLRSRPKPKCICINPCVRKDPDGPALPRLEICNLTPGVAFVAGGDQTGHRYRICNNDPDAFFRGVLCVKSCNESRRPLDESSVPAPPGSRPVAVSAPVEADDFPIAFGDVLGGECIRLPDPLKSIEPTLKREIILAPCEWIEVDVIVRPWGMCANGSCGSVTVELDGHFADSTMSQGRACTTAVVAVDSRVPPQFVWPDSGVITQVVPNPQRPDTVVLRVPDIPQAPIPAGAEIPIEMVSMQLQSAQPIQVEFQQTHAAPLNSDLADGHSRLETQNFMEPFQIAPGGDVFFDVFTELRIGQPGDNLSITNLVSSAEGGLVGPDHPFTGMFEAFVPAGGDFDVDSFFDITYQAIGTAWLLDPLNPQQPVPLPLTPFAGEILPGPAPGTVGLQLQLQAVVLNPGQGGGRGVVGPGGPEIVQVDIYQDFRGFVRPGPVVTCDNVSIIDLKCTRMDDLITMNWGVAPPGCLCEEIRIVDQATGQILFSLPGTATSHEIFCPEIASLTGQTSGVICVECIDVTGNVAARSCCEWNCDECPPLQIDRCEVLSDGRLALAWPAPPAGCCDEILVVARTSMGDIQLASTPGRSCDIVLHCDELIAATGATSGIICIQCIKDGQVIDDDCCDWSCPTDCPPQYSMDCAHDPATGAVTLTWSPAPPLDCCQSIHIKGSQDPAAPTVMTLPGTASTVTLTCAEIATLGLPQFGVICVYCEEPTGLTLIGCCDYSCPDPCPPLNPQCVVDTSTNEVCLSWTPPSPNCCQEVLIVEPTTGQALGAATPGTLPQFKVPCKDLFQITGQTSGQLCVECVAPDGTVTRECCDWECERPCPPLNLTCDTVPGQGVTFSWNPNIPAECCETFEIRIPSSPPVVIGSLPGGIGISSTSVSCADLVAASGGATSGVVCVVCIAPDGTEMMECCDWSCPCPPIEILRCEINAQGALALLWNQIPVDCCAGFRIEVDGNAIGTLAGGTSMRVFQAFCSQFGGGAHEICIVCIDRDGNEVDRACCAVECPDPCVLSVDCAEAVDAAGRPAVQVSWTASGPCECASFLITFGADAVTVPASDTSIVIPCAKLAGTNGVICVRCIGPNGNTQGFGCCDYTCPTVDPCDPECTYDGCNRVKSTTWLCPDQLDFKVWISLRTVCGDRVVKSCRPCFRLSDIAEDLGLEDPRFLTLQQKCRALVNAINNDPCCQALGYQVLPGDDHCDVGPPGCFCSLASEECPWFIVTDTTCPTGQLVMGISNDENILDQNEDGVLPDYEAEEIQTLWTDPTPNDPGNGDEPGVVIGFEGVATGMPIVNGDGLGGGGHVPHVRLRLRGPRNSASFDSFFDIDVECRFGPGKTAAEIARDVSDAIEIELVALQLRGTVEVSGGQLTVSNIGSSGLDGGGAGDPGGQDPEGFGASVVTNDTGISTGSNVGPTCAVDGDPSDCPDGPSAGGSVMPGDVTGEGTLPDITDAIAHLELAFLGVTGAGQVELICGVQGDGNAGFEEDANIAAYDINGDGLVDFSDAIRLLGWLFIGGPPAVQGTECILVPDCPDVCTP